MYLHLTFMDTVWADFQKNAEVIKGEAKNLPKHNITCQNNKKARKKNRN
jgi:hypothetical protein